MKKIVALGLVALVASGCSSLTVSSDWDRDAPFQTYRTYQWKPVRPSRGEPGNLMTELIQKRIERSVQTYLEQAGFQRKDSDADVLVVAHLGVKDKINVTDWGYSYSRDYWGYGGRNIDVYQYQEGTLVLDMIDASSNELVWRGWATKTIDPDAGGNPERVDREVDRAVGAILARFPPPPRS